MIVVYYCTCIWFAFAAVTGGIIFIYICTCDGVERTVQLDGMC